MDVARGELAVNPRIAEIRKIVDRIVEVEIVVEHAVHEIFQVVHSGQGEATLDDVGVFEERVCGVIGAE